MSTTISGTSGLTFPNASTSTVGGLGDGQTWQLLTASRSSGVTYTNNTGKPIVVYVIPNASSGYWTINGQNSVSGTVTGQSYAAMTMIVPNGQTYMYTGGLQTWAELR